MRGVPGPVPVTFARRPVHLARDDGLAMLAERMTHGALRRVSAAAAVRGIGAAGSGPRRCAAAQEEAGQAAPPPAARLPNIPGRHGAALPRPLTLSVHVSRILREIG